MGFPFSTSGKPKVATRFNPDDLVAAAITPRVLAKYKHILKKPVAEGSSDRYNSLVKFIYAEMPPVDAGKIHFRLTYNYDDLYDYTYSRFSKSIVLQKIIPLLNKKANYELDSIENVLIKDDPQRQEYKPTDAEDAKRLINQRYVERRTIDQSTPGKAKLPLTAPKPPEPDFDWSKLPVTSPFNMPGNFLLGQKYSHSVFLRAKITENLSVSDRVIRSKARAHLNKMLSKQMHSKVPPSHEWFNLDMRLLFLRYLFEAMYDMGGDSPVLNTTYPQDELTEFVLKTELEFETQHGILPNEMDEMADLRNPIKAGTARAVRCNVSHHNPNFDSRSKPKDPVAKHDQIDEDTKGRLGINVLEDKIQQFFSSFSSEDYAQLLLAWIKVYDITTDYYKVDFDQAKKNREKFEKTIFNEAVELLPGIDGWEDAQDMRFPSQVPKLLEAAEDLIGLAMKHVKNKNFEQALRFIDIISTHVPYTGKLIYDYIEDRDRKGRRFVFVIKILKSIAFLGIDIIILKNVKGVFKTLAALYTKSLLTQEYDKQIGERTSISFGRAAIDVLMTKITFGINSALMTRFSLELKSLTTDAILAITDTFIGSLEAQIEELVKNSMSFEDFLRGIFEKFIQPENWIVNLAGVAIARSYTPTNAPITPSGVGGKLAPVVIAPKLGRSSIPPPPPVTAKPEKSPANGDADFKSAREFFNSKLRDGYAKLLGVALGSGGQVHHAIELQVLAKYPRAFSATELNKLSNMRGIPAELNILGQLDKVSGRKQLHNAKIRYEWDRLYKMLDAEILAKKLKPGNAKYNSLVRFWLKEGASQIDYLVGQFFSEIKIKLYDPHLKRITTLSPATR